MTRPLFIILCFIGLGTNVLSQQTRSDLEIARLEIIKSIEETQLRLADAELNKESTLSKLNALEKQIDARSALIKNLQEDASLSNQTITTEVAVQEATESKSSYLAEDYNKLLRIRYRNKLLNKNLSSLYNTGRLNELITKWRYLKTYGAMLAAKGSEINRLDNKVDNMSTNIQTEKTNYTRLIEKEQNARDSLKLLMQKLSTAATKMTSKEKLIKQQLEVQNQKREQFNKAIEQTIFSSLGSNINLSSSATGISQKSILDKKGFLPWPLTSATLVTRHGPQPHPTVSGIVVDNKGIDISSSSSSVTAIFTGEVISVAEVKGSGMTVIVKHQNEIYSVYANLNTVSAIKSQRVEQGTILGQAKSGTNGLPNMHFELYQGKQNLNPNHWLKNN